MRCEISSFRAWFSLVLRASKEEDCTSSLGSHHVYVGLAEKGRLQHQIGLYFCPKLNTYLAPLALNDVYALRLLTWSENWCSLSSESQQSWVASTMKSLFKIIVIYPSDKPFDLKCPLPKMSVFPSGKTKKQTKQNPHSFTKKNSNCHWEIFPMNIQCNFMVLFFSW